MALLIFALSTIILNCATGLNIPEAPAPICEACAENDLIFIVDSSGSINQTNYVAELTFIQNILDPNKQNLPKFGAQIGLEVQVSVMIFNTYVNPYLTFAEANNYNTVYQFLESAKNNSGPGGQSNLCMPMNFSMIEFQNQGRMGVPKTLMILTDGDPNSRTGRCTPTIAVQLANTMKTSSTSVEILCVAVAGNDGYQPASNMPFLQQIASRVSVNGVSTPLVWSLTDPNALNSAQQVISSRMSCCACYPDLSQTVEMDDTTSGSSGSFTESMYSNINAVAKYWFDVNAQYQLYAQNGLITFSSSELSAVRIFNCTDMNCWNNILKTNCPQTLGYSGNCLWAAGYTDIKQGLAQSMNLFNSYGFGQKSATNINILHWTGNCNAKNTNECSPSSLANTESNYQSKYYWRIGDVLYIGSATNVTAVNQAVGDHSATVKGPGSGYNNNANCLIYSVIRVFTDVPGCQYQPYINNPSYTQNTCQLAY